MIALASTRRRPRAVGTVRKVDGGLHQGTCVCRWHGTRLDEHAAFVETSEHVATCGICVDVGRDYLEVCTCANCQRRRYFRDLHHDRGEPPVSTMVDTNLREELGAAAQDLAAVNAAARERLAGANQMHADLATLRRGIVEAAALLTPEQRAALSDDTRAALSVAARDILVPFPGATT